MFRHRSVHGTPASTDVMALQTAASLENLTIALYRSALRRPALQGQADPVPDVVTFLNGAIGHHLQHAGAFNAAIEHLGGTQQTGLDPRYEPMMTTAMAATGTLAGVVALAARIEDIGVATYCADIALVSTGALRTLFAGVCGVEAQHRAYLLSVQVLTRSDLAQLVTAPPQPDLLPASIGEPIAAAFYPTTNASPITEGAIA